MTNAAIIMTHSKTGKVFHTKTAYQTAKLFPGVFNAYDVWFAIDIDRPGEVTEKQIETALKSLAKRNVISQVSEGYYIHPRGFHTN